MNPLEFWHLKRLCEKHGLDYQEIDSSLTYWENKEHLKTLVIEGEEEGTGDSMLEWWMQEHFLTYYVGCVQEGLTVSEETGAPIQTRFSLKQWIISNSH